MISRDITHQVTAEVHTNLDGTDMQIEVVLYRRTVDRDYADIGYRREVKTLVERLESWNLIPTTEMEM